MRHMSIATTSAARPAERDRRLTDPILTVGQVAALENMSYSTANSWAHSGLLTTTTNLKRGWPTVPLLGLADAHLARRMRHVRLPVEEVRAVLAAIRRAGPHGYATLSQQLVTDGLYALLEGEDGELTRIVGGQALIPEVTKAYKTRLLVDEDGIVDRYVVDRIPGTVIKPGVNGGRMTFTSTGVPVFAIAGALAAGGSPQGVADDFRIAVEQVASVREADPAWVSQVA